MAKLGKSLDAYDLERELPGHDAEGVRPGAHAYFLDLEGCHRLIGQVYVDVDGDVILEEVR